MSLDHALLHQRPRYPGSVNPKVESPLPTSISDLKFWFSAKSITGKSDGDSVTQWDDLSGNGLHATEATYAPLYYSSVINGLPGLRFGSHANTKLSISSTTQTYMSVFVVVYILAKSVSYPIVYQEDNINTGIVILSNNQSYWSFRYATTTYSAPSATYVSGQPNILTMRLGSIPVGYYDGAAVAGGAVIGAERSKTHTIGNANDNSRQTNGYIGELFAFDRVITNDELIKMHTYLSKAWNITI